jgi:hypothetical protein
MKALTICQPYASLIMLPFSDPRAKRTENRGWHSSYVGPLAIHAGKSREWLDEDPGGNPGLDAYGFEIADLFFGYILGVVDQIACLRPDDVRFRYPKLKEHQHIEGPWCHVYANVRPFAKPVAWKGAQGPWNVPDDVIAAALAVGAK